MIKNSFNDEAIFYPITRLFITIEIGVSIMVNIIQTSTREEYIQGKELFEEYAKSINIDLAFQSFDDELKDVSKKYGPSAGGSLLLAKDGEQIIGCVALRKIDENICEMKRLYVQPEAKGKGLGRKLAEAIIEQAKNMGYSFMRLDTLKTMKPAVTLYQSLGFYPIDPYIFNPLENALFLELNLVEK